MSESIFLLDGTALAYRAYYAFISNPLINSKGENTSVVFGFTNSLIKIYKDYFPDYIAVVFDTAEPTFRHKKYPEYKAHRPETPPEIIAQLPRMKDVISAFNITILEKDGYEADDVIGTIAKRAESMGMDVVLFTADKDFQQLVNDKIKMLKPAKGEKGVEWIDKDGVVKNFGVPPEKVVEVLGLMGDASDNVPGVPKIGEKTALQLIQQFGDIESAIARADEIKKNQIRENLKKYADQARLSKELVTINTNVPIDIDFSQLKMRKFNNEKILEVFRELEFALFIDDLMELEEKFRKVENKTARPQDYKTTRLQDYETTRPPDYKTIKTNKDLDDLISYLNTQRFLSIDIEATSEDAMLADLVGISVSVKPNEAFYIPVGHLNPEREQQPLILDKYENLNTEIRRDGDELLNIDKNYVIQKLKPIFENPNIEKYGHNIKYDSIVLARNDINLRGITFDTMISAFLVETDEDLKLKSLAMKHLQKQIKSFDEMFPPRTKNKNIALLPIKDVSDYSCADADVTLQLKNIYEPKLEQEQMKELFYKIEMPLIDVLKEMEMHGIALDKSFLVSMSVDVDKQLKDLTNKIYSIAGEEFNINSPKQLGKILFEKLKLRSIRKTKGGSDSTDVSVLEELAKEHELPRILVEYRQLEKLKSTYIDALPELINPNTKRLHTSYNQTVVTTGRLSSSNPNLQNIPIRTELGKEIRKAFISPDNDTVIVSADYSQIELRVMAHISGDENLTLSFNNREDVHSRTASLIFDIPISDVTSEQRRQAKTVNFGVMYGMSPHGLAQSLGITHTQAGKFIDEYFERYKGVKKYIDDTIESAHRDGYVKTLFNRKRYLPDLQSKNHNLKEFAERVAINTPIQGTAADIMKLAMIEVHNELKKRNLKTKMILQVHDELLFEVPIKELDEIKALLKDKMENIIKLKVPLEIDIGVGKNWYEAH